MRSNHNDGARDMPNPLNDTLVDRLFEKIDVFGLDHVEVTGLVKEHPELQEYLDFAREQERRDQQRKQKVVIVGTMLSGMLCAVGAFVIWGVYLSFQFPIVEKELASAKHSLEQSSSEADELKNLVQKQKGELALYANARNEIEEAKRAQKEAIVAAQRAKDALAVSEKQEKNLKDALETAVKAREKANEDLQLAKSAQTKQEMEAVALKKSWAEAVDETKLVKTALEKAALGLEQQKKENAKLKDSSYLDALELAQCSQYRNVALPKGMRLFDNLASGKGTSAGSRYALAIRADNEGRESEYKLLLEDVVRQGKSPWEKLASAELRGLSGDPEPILDLLTGLEGQLDRPPEGVPFAFVLLQRDVAHQAVFRLHLKTKSPVLKGLLETTKKGKQQERVAAISAIGAFGPAAKDATPVLIDMIDERYQPEPVIQWEAAMALGKIGPAADSSAKALLVLSGRSGVRTDPAVAAAAYQALLKIIGPPLTSSKLKF